MLSRIDSALGSISNRASTLRLSASTCLDDVLETYRDVGRGHNLAERFNVDAAATLGQTCVDRRRQWKNAKNIRHNAAIRSTFWTATHPRHWFQRAREA